MGSNGNRVHFFNLEFFLKKKQDYIETNSRLSTLVIYTIVFITKNLSSIKALENKNFFPIRYPEKLIH